MPKFKTREEWLKAAVVALDKEVFAPTKQRMPKDWRVTCGWPHTGATRSKSPTIGQCWDRVASSDRHVEIIIGMSLDNASRVLDVLAHEMVHAIVGHKCGHKGPFKSLATGIGLTGKMTQTVAGPELTAKLAKLCKTLGPYPHKRLNIMKQIKKQTTRLLKVECSECGYVARVTSKWIDEVGAPLCPCNGEPMEVASQEE